jgi:hypothetical protein
MISVHVCVRFHCFKKKYIILLSLYNILHSVGFIREEGRGPSTARRRSACELLYMAQPTAYVPVSVCTLCIFAGVILVLEVFMCMQSYSNDII